MPGFEIVAKRLTEQRDTIMAATVEEISSGFDRKMTLARRYRSYMEGNSLSLRDGASRLEITVSMLSAILNGHMNGKCGIGKRIFDKWAAKLDTGKKGKTDEL